MAINLAELSLPPGWRRTLVRAEGSGDVPVLTAAYPAESLRVEAHPRDRCRPVLGLYRPPGKFCELEIRIGTGYPRHVRPAHFIDDRTGGIQEAVLDPVDAETLVLELRPVQRLASVCGLAWIRFEPVAQEYPACWQKHNVGAVCDTHGMFARGGLSGTEDIEALLAPFGESDFDRVCWGIGAGSFRMLYFSDVLPYFGTGQSSFFNEANARVAAGMVAMKRSGVDPLAVAVDFCHRQGLELWASDRICHCWAPGGFNDDFSAPFYLDNQHLRTVNADGEREATLSLAHREFQDLKLALYRELAERDVDGIYIDLLRKPGVMGFDEPVVRAFEKRTGRSLDKADHRSETWLNIRAGFVTDFMRRVRAALDEIGDRRGRPVKIAVQGFSGRIYTGSCVVDENLLQGYDIAAWAREGLIDIFAPSTSRHYRPLSLAFHRELLRGTPCALWGCLGQHHDCLFASDYNHQTYFGNDPDKRITPIADLDALRVMGTAAECYAQKAEGVFLWEAGEAPNCPVRWNELRTLGHRQRWLKALAPVPGVFDGRERIRQWRVV